MISAGEHIFRAGALALLVACLAVSGIALTENLIPSWNGAPLLLFCVLAAIEAYAACRLLRGGRFRTSLAQVTLLLILAQLYVDALDQRAPLADGVPYLTGKAFAYAIPVFLVWLAITEVTRALMVLERPPEQGFLDQYPVRRLTAYFFLGGASLFVTAALTQPGIAQTMKLAHGSAGPILNVLAYFLVGVVFLGRLEYSALHHRWLVQRTTVARGMASRCTGYVLAFTIAVALLALILPTSRTLGILGPGRDAWDQLVLLLRGPLSSLLSWLHPSRPTVINPHLKPPPGFHLPPRRPPATHHGSGGGGNWFSVIETALFWAGVLALTVYLVRQYARRARGRIRRPRPRHLPGLRGMLARLLAALVRRLRAVFDAVAEHLPDPVTARLAVSLKRRPRGRGGHVLGGPTRQQIIAYYRRMVRQAEQRGVHHDDARTPEEFAAALTPLVPSASGDVAVLTDAYVEARYSRHELAADRLTLVRAGWESIRRALRPVKR
jgi:hypothetical protein